MKTMTCGEISGGRITCDEQISGNTADDMAKNAYEHIKNATDEAHQGLLKNIDSSSEEKKASWMQEFQGKFDAAPDA